MRRLLVVCVVVLAACASKKPDQRAECNELYGRSVRLSKDVNVTVEPERKQPFIDACMKLPADVIHCEVSDDVSDHCMEVVATNRDLIDLQFTLHGL